MPVSAISNIVFAIGITEFLACIIARKFIFQSESYTRTVEAFGRAKWRRDKTAASLVIKQSNPKSQKAAEKEAKKLAKEKNGGSDDGEDKQDEKGDENDAEEEDEVFYGAPDDHAWTDASHAIKESEKNKDDGPDTSVSYSLAAHHRSLNASLNSTCN